MSDDLKNILSNTEGNISQDMLFKYLKNELADAEKHDVEKRLIDDGFEADAMDGLQEVENPEKLMLIVDALNRDLKKKAEKKTQSRRKTDLKPQWIVYFSILILLIIIVMIYLFLHIRMNG